jgi:hypothetical protein
MLDPPTRQKQKQLQQKKSTFAEGFKRRYGDWQKNDCAENPS